MYSGDWTLLGSRPRLSRLIRSATGIDQDLLDGSKNLQSYSIAQRMSWASRCHTTRIEDIAYCLLGLFHVSMPLLYGEGERAFRRLQETIIQTTDDETIFAWSGVETNGTGLLAKKPARFSDAAAIAVDHGAYPRPSYTMTSGGLSMEFELSPCLMNTYITLLRCCRALPGRRAQQIGIYLCRTLVDDQYRRIPVDDVDLFSAEDQRPKEAWPYDGTPVKTVRVYAADTPMVPLAPRGGLPAVSFFQPQSLPTTIHVLGIARDELRQTPKLRRRPMTSLSTEQQLRRHLPPSPICQLGSIPSVSLDTEWQNPPNIITLKDRKRGVTLKYLPIILRVGFNSDFEPVCFVSSRRMLWRGRERIKSFVFDQNATYSRLVGKLMLPIPGPRPTWVIKGHRLHGLEAIIVHYHTVNTDCLLAITLRRDPRAASGLTWRLTVDELYSKPTVMGQIFEIVYYFLAVYIGLGVFFVVLILMVEFHLISTQPVENWGLAHRFAKKLVVAVFLAFINDPFVVGAFVWLSTYWLYKFVLRWTRAETWQAVDLATKTEEHAERIFADRSIT